MRRLAPFLVAVLAALTVGTIAGSGGTAPAFFRATDLDTFTLTASNDAGAGTPSAPSPADVPTGADHDHPDLQATTPRPEIPAYTAPSGPRPTVPPGH